MFVSCQLNLLSCSFLRSSKRSSTIPNIGITLLLTMKVAEQACMTRKPSSAAFGLHRLLNCAWAWNIRTKRTGLHWTMLGLHWGTSLGTVHLRRHIWMWRNGRSCWITQISRWKKSWHSWTLLVFFFFLLWAFSMGELIKRRCLSKPCEKTGKTVLTRTNNSFSPINGCNSTEKISSV